MPGPDSLRGSRLGHYLVESLVSSGGFGTVFRVTRDGKPYALKLPLMDDPFEYQADRKVFEQRITREVISLMTLKHPNIVRVHAFDRWPHAETGALYLVMDFVEGLPLLQWLAQAKPTLREVVEVFRTLGLALAEMHRLGVVHRDLKSSNILVSAETDKRFPARWKPVIVDFGLARPAFTHDVTREHALLGTEGLWAPEQLKAALQLHDNDTKRPAHSQYTAASDLHALGLLLYEALTGRRAFRAGGGAMAALLTTVPRAPSFLNRAIPECIDATVMRLLAQNPGERHADGAELADALGQLLEEDDPRWDAPATLPETTKDTPEPAVTADERPSPLVLKREDIESLIRPSPVQPFFPRRSDALDALSRTAEVSVTPVLRRSATPGIAPRATSQHTAQGGGLRRKLLVLAATGLALAAGATVGVVARHALKPRSADNSASTLSLPSSAAPPPPVALSGPAAREVFPIPTETPALRPAPRPNPSPPLPPRSVVTAPTPARNTARATVAGRVQSGPTEATLLEPVSVRGQVLPIGTLLTGSASELGNGLGYRLSFDRARLSSGAVHPLSAKGFAAETAGRRVPLRAGALPVRVELDLTFEASAGGLGVR